MPFGRVGSNQGYWQASGESTPSEKVPEKFEATPQPNSPVGQNMTFGADFAWDINRAPVVQRRPRMNGMRYLYARGAMRMPIQRLGADGTPVPWRSGFQPNLQGPIHDAGFNDALFQAGYPGFNLGLSFKVPTLPTQGGPRTNMTGANRGQSGPMRGSNKVTRVNRPTGRPGLAK